MLKQHFGLEVIVLHEMLSDDMVRWADKHGTGSIYERVFYTTCYLILPDSGWNQTSARAEKSRKPARYIDNLNHHTAFRQTIDPSQLMLSDSQRNRFSKAMRLLGLELCYHLTELEPHIEQLIEDETLLSKCACKDERKSDTSVSNKACDHHYDMNSFLEEKSKGIFLILAVVTWVS